jgi:thiamine biosynthesis protein ThiI
MPADTHQLFLVHYHEIGLKGKNRGRFENQLVKNIQTSLKEFPGTSPRRLSGRVIVDLPEDAPVDAIGDRIGRVFGVANYSLAIRCESDIETIRNVAWSVARQSEFETFKVAAKRADKLFPLNSVGVNVDVGSHIQVLSGAQVRMADPDLTCYVEISHQGTFVYTLKHPGPGGLPVGANERALSLLSSGIDSPVASYRIMKRGVRLAFIHFHSHPYTNRASQHNTEELVRILTGYQYKSSLYLVPFLELQRHVMTHAPAGYRVILYRRAMFRIAEAVAASEGSQALVTGENVGQVASQTLSNLRAIEEVTALPILRPLAGHNKEEIIKEARQIGTYEISTEPYEDCCTVFIPKHPETRANLNTVRGIESRLNMSELINRTVQATEIKRFEF